jgi:hypothetical protein
MDLVKLTFLGIIIVSIMSDIRRPEKDLVNFLILGSLIGGAIITIATPEMLIDVSRIIPKSFNLEPTALRGATIIMASCCLSSLYIGRAILYRQLNQRKLLLKQSILQLNIIKKFGNEQFTTELGKKIDTLNASTLEALQEELPSFSQIDEVDQWIETNA